MTERSPRATAAVHRGTAEVLDETPLFAAMSPTARARVVGASRMHVYDRGDVVFFEADRPTAVHVVASGLLRVFVTSFDGSEPTLALLSEGTVVGELGVLADVPRSASVAALRRSQLVEIPGEVFREVYDTEPAVPRRLVELLSDRLRTTSDGLADLTYLDLGGRLAKYLLRECERTGDTTLVLTLNQTELGQMIGGARQTVNQLLQSLERANLIVVEGRTIRVVDRDGLQLRALSAH
jgi:CRP/FNR family transcriptional regulator, cyclic AMP receptor protein